MGHSRNDEAIKLAVQGRWKEAVATNQEILEISPNDIDSLNRLGKALSELGRNAKSRKAYERVLELDPHNSIARRNLDRLSLLKDNETSSKGSRGIDSRFFIEETNKARRVNLRRLAPEETLGKMAAGDPVDFRINNGRLEIINNSGEFLGEVDPKIGARLVRLMQGGNEYKAAIINLGTHDVKVIIRETFQHPSQIGYNSFPPPRTMEEIRPYLKDSMVKRGTEEEPPKEAVEIEDWEHEEEPLEESDVLLDDEASALKEDGDKVI